MKVPKGVRGFLLAQASILLSSVTIFATSSNPSTDAGRWYEPCENVVLRGRGSGRDSRSLTGISIDGSEVKVEGRKIVLRPIEAFLLSALLRQPLSPDESRRLTFKVFSNELQNNAVMKDEINVRWDYLFRALSLQLARNLNPQMSQAFLTFNDDNGRSDNPVLSLIQDKSSKTGKDATAATTATEFKSSLESTIETTVEPLVVGDLSFFQQSGRVRVGETEIILDKHKSVLMTELASAYPQGSDLEGFKSKWNITDDSLDRHILQINKEFAGADRDRRELVSRVPGEIFVLNPGVVRWFEHQVQINPSTQEEFDQDILQISEENKGDPRQFRAYKRHVIVNTVFKRVYYKGVDIGLNASSHQDSYNLLMLLFGATAQLGVSIADIYDRVYGTKLTSVAIPGRLRMHRLRLIDKFKAIDPDFDSLVLTESSVGGSTFRGMAWQDNEIKDGPHWRGLVFAEGEMALRIPGKAWLPIEPRFYRLLEAMRTNEEASSVSDRQLSRNIKQDSEEKGRFGFVSTGEFMQGLDITYEALRDRIVKLNGKFEKYHGLGLPLIASVVARSQRILGYMINPALLDVRSSEDSQDGLNWRGLTFSIGGMSVYEKRWMPLNPRFRKVLSIMSKKAQVASLSNARGVPVFDENSSRLLAVIGFFSRAELAEGYSTIESLSSRVASLNRKFKRYDRHERDLVLGVDDQGSPTDSQNATGYIINPDLLRASSGEEALDGQYWRGLSFGTQSIRVKGNEWLELGVGLYQILSFMRKEEVESEFEGEVEGSSHSEDSEVFGVPEEKIVSKTLVDLGYISTNALEQQLSITRLALRSAVSKLNREFKDYDPLGRPLVIGVDDRGVAAERNQVTGYMINPDLSQ